MKKYEITGMSCSACVARVERAVKGVEGVKACSVSLLTNSMLLDGEFDSSEVMTAVKNAGYIAVEQNEDSAITDTSDRFLDKESPRLKRRFYLSIGFLAALMYISMGHVMWGWYLPDFLSHPITIATSEAILALVVMIINGKFFVNGFKALLNRSPNMDTLVALGSGVSYAYSLYLYFAMLFSENQHHYLHEFYFESSAMILALITVGKILEAMAKGKTTSALKSLMDLSPKIATVIKDGKEVVVKASELLPGDIFVVRNGESIPADGVILEGEATINEASLTGESVPADKGVGDYVSASTINASGYIKCRAERTGKDTVFSQIIKTVTEATATKAPIAKIADRVSGIFVPTIILIALFVTGIWLITGSEIGFAVGRGISVLVISCPCALGLATPVAIMVGSGAGARNGILFKTAQALEQTGRAQTVVFDKTGTITAGKMSVKDIIPISSLTEIELLSYATSAEQRSEHPLAKAIAQRGEEMSCKPLNVTEFHSFTGSGVLAIVDGREIVGGRAEFISNYAHIPQDFFLKADELARDGKTPLFFAVDKEFIGIIAISDTIKESSKSAVEWLKHNKIKVVMLTGDNERTARAIAKEVGIDNVIAQVMPNEKERAIRELCAEGKTIMVGDGVNDAPALAVADVGIAIGGGTDVAIDSSEVVVMKSDLIDVCNAIKLSRATLKNIRENLFWAFFYNVIAIPIASGAFVGLGLTLNPMIGALAMSLSSFCVVTNALRLNFFKTIKNEKEQIEMENDNMVVVLKVEGMMCPHCEARVKEALEKLDGVRCAKPNHKKKAVKIDFEAPATVEQLKNAVTEAGYKVI